jgi:hypothetical protein
MYRGNGILSRVLPSWLVGRSRLFQKCGGWLWGSYRLLWESNKSYFLFQNNQLNQYIILYVIVNSDVFWRIMGPRLGVSSMPERMLDFKMGFPPPKKTKKWIQILHHCVHCALWYIDQ